MPRTIIRTNPDKTNAKSRAATLASFLVGGILILATNYGYEFDSELVQWITTGIAIFLLPMAVKYAGYMKPLDSTDIQIINNRGDILEEAVDVVANTLNEIDPKTGKRKKLKKFLKIAGTILKFLT